MTDIGILHDAVLEMRGYDDTMETMQRTATMVEAMRATQERGCLCMTVLSSSCKNNCFVACDVTRPQTHTVPLLLRPRITGVSLLNNSDKTYEHWQLSETSRAHRRRM